uniref:PIH1 domain-containing protein 1 (Trinotate prediction) n=1 Tax=Henneguya salminicola TaxID=69463 RepID=A0A6G3MHG0_HENSL
MATRELLDISQDRENIKSKFIFFKNDEEKFHTVKNEIIKPIPLFCLKALCKDENKIFINFCTSPLVPEPCTTNEYEIMEKMTTHPEKTCIPICVGPPHKENDNEGYGL